MNNTRKEGSTKMNFSFKPTDKAKKYSYKYKQLTLTQMDSIFPQPLSDSSVKSGTNEHSVKVDEPNTPGATIESTSALTDTAVSDFSFEDYKPGEIIDVAINEEGESLTIKAPKLQYSDPPRAGFLTEHVYLNCKRPERNHWDQTTVPIPSFTSTILLARDSSKINTEN